MGTTKNSTAPILRCSLCGRPIRRNASYIQHQGEPRHNTCNENDEALR